MDSTLCVADSYYKMLCIIKDSTVNVDFKMRCMQECINLYLQFLFTRTITSDCEGLSNGVMLLEIWTKDVSIGAYYEPIQWLDKICNETKVIETTNNLLLYYRCLDIIAELRELCDLEPVSIPDIIIA